MAKITLASGFSIIPEGVYTFLIKGVQHDVDFGKLKISCAAADGTTHDETYKLIKTDGSANEGAIKAFSFFARRVLDDNTLTEIDPAELVGHYFNARVEHTQTEKRDKPGEYWTNVSLQDITAAYGYDGKDVPEAADIDDLDDILG